jgi:RNase P subunit RPR2
MFVDLSFFEEKLRTLSRGEVPSAVVAKLKYMWTVAHEMAKTSPQLSHAASLEFKNLVMRDDVVLPRRLTEKLCSGCERFRSQALRVLLE